MRGRRRQPDEIKRLRGNPHGHRLHLERAAEGAPPPHPRRFAVEPPHYLTEKAERDAFNMALASLPANVARASDTNAVARWAVWLHVWVQCKSSLGSNKAEPDWKSHHRRMRDAESALVRLEDRLGLSPAARNSIVQGLFQVPAANFEAIEPAQPVPDDGESPLGFLLRHGRRH
jgi:phage terminase small subunit